MIQEEPTRLISVDDAGNIRESELSEQAVIYDRFQPGEGVPTREIKLSSQSKRQEAKGGGGIFQRARDAEKKEMIVLLNSKTADVNHPLNVMKGTNWNEYIFGLPNAKWGWINAFLKRLINGTEKVNTCDRQLYLNMWMTPSASEISQQMFKIPGIAARFDNKASIFARFPTRSKMPIYCDNGVLKMNLKNPGVLNLYTGEVEHYPNMQSLYSEVEAYNKYDNNVDWHTGRVKQAVLPTCSSSISSGLQNTADSCSCHDVDENFMDLGTSYLRKLNDMKNEYETKLKIYQETSALDFLDTSDKYKRLIDYVRDTLYEKHIPWNKFSEITKAFNAITSMQESKYILSLINPFKHRLTKVPSEFPIPTSSFSIRHNFNVTTNALGNVAFAISPFFVGTAGQTNTTAWLNNDATLTGAASSNFFLGFNIGQTPPSNFYSAYRLVSSGLKITFTSSELNSTGFCTVGIDFTNPGVGAIPNPNANLAQYGDFSLIENSYFKDSKSTRSGDALELNYIPLDSSFLDFITPGTGRTGFNFLAYIAGAQPSTVIARVDIVANFEGTVAAGFTDYLPCQVYTGDLDDLKYVNSALSQVKNNNMPLSPLNLEKALVKEDVSKPNVITVGPPKHEIKQALDMVSVLNDLQKHTSDQIKDKLESPDKKRSWLNKAMDYTAPIASHIMQAALSALTKKYTIPNMK